MAFQNPQRRRNRYDPRSPEPFRLSRSKLDLFFECPRCFYLDRRLGVGRPPGFPFNLNTAVDTLLKKEFDIHRAAGTPHPLMKAYGIAAVPYADERLKEWRDSLTRGVRHLHEPTKFLVTGGVDDVWVNSRGELHVVDYKATSKNGEVNLDAKWQDGYKRQVELYQWLFRRNGFRVSNVAYFVYCNGDTDKEAFDGKLEFSITILPYEGGDAWVEQALQDAWKCLAADTLPQPGTECNYCAYRNAVRSVE